MFDFIKKAFFTVLTILSNINPLSGTNLKCVSMDNQRCRVRPEIVMLKVTSLYFILLLLKQVNAAVILTISMIRMQKFVFLKLLKT